MAGGTKIAVGVGHGLQKSHQCLYLVDYVSSDIAGAGGTIEERGEVGARPGKENEKLLQVSRLRWWARVLDNSVAQTSVRPSCH